DGCSIKAALLAPGPHRTRPPAASPRPLAQGEPGPLVSARSCTPGVPPLQAAIHQPDAGTLRPSSSPAARLPDSILPFLKQPPAAAAKHHDDPAGLGMWQ